MFQHFFLYAQFSSYLILLHQDTNIEEMGIPSRDQIVLTYCKYSQRHHQTQLSPLSSLPAKYDEANAWAGFYLSFLFFKNCVIVHGVAQRALSGVASSGMASRVAKLLPNMTQLNRLIWSKFPPPTSQSEDCTSNDVEWRSKL